MVFAGGMAKRQAQRWQVAIRRWTQQAKRPGAGRESFIWHGFLKYVRGDVCAGERKEGTSQDLSSTRFVSGWSCIDYHGHSWPSCQAASLFGFDKNVQKLAPFWRWCSPTVLVQKASRAPRGSVPPLDHTRNDTHRHSGCCVLKPGWNPAWTYIVEQIHFRNVYQAIWSWHLVTQLFCCCPLFGLKCYGLHSCRGLWGASGSSQIRT